MSKIIMQIKRVPRMDISPNYGCCQDDCIATYTLFTKMNHELMYYDALNNWFDDTCDESTTYAEQIKINPKLEEDLKKYVGLEIVMSKEPFCEAKPRILEYLSKEVPVLAGIKESRWDTNLQMMINRIHTIYLIGYDAEKNLFECIDPYYDKQVVQYELNKFQPVYDSYGVFQKSEVAEFDPFEELLDKLKAFKEMKLYDSMRKLADCIQEKFDLEKEVLDYQQSIMNEDENPYTDKLIEKILINREIKEIAYNRIRFASLLEYLGGQNFEYIPLIEYANDFKYIAEKWNMLRLIIAKYVYSKQTKPLSDFMSRKMKLVVQEEEALVDKIIHLIETKSLDNLNPKDISKFSMISNTVPIDIKTYMNNVGIGNSGHEKADFNNLEEYFVNQSFPNGKTIKFEDMRFKVAEKENGEPDNISCASQKIQIDNVECSSIMLLGCSEWGDFTDDFVLEYTDGERQVIPIKLYNWIPGLNSEASNKIAVNAEKIVMSKQGDLIDTEDAYLYAVLVPIQRKQLNSITLPECMNMHVFAISLGI